MMAGAAGFEPAVPGLGGRCIIQAMLHARSREHDLLKKCALKNNRFFHTDIRCHQAEKAPRENVASSSSDLPNPYGEDTPFGQTSENALNRRVRIRDSQRVLWTGLSTIRGSRRARMLTSFLAILATCLFAVSYTHLTLPTICSV